ncbi:MAG: hypothetical protein ACKVW3_02900 [Phycisphaerales bacterium]
MDMPQYLAEIRHAVGVSIGGVWAERTLLEGLEKQVAAFTTATNVGYHQAQFAAMNAEDADDAAMAAGMHFETYFGVDKERHHKAADVEDLQAQIAVHAFAEASLAASLLQYAKQGMSIVHGSLSKVPDGRQIGSQALKEVVWQARNQTMHWEEGKLHPPVVQCFETLIKERGPAFTDFCTRGMGFEVVRDLGWKTAADFEKDMMLLA